MQLESTYGIELDSFTDLVRLVSSVSPDHSSMIFKPKRAPKIFSDLY